MNESEKNSARYAIVAAEFYPDIADALIEGAVNVLTAAGIARENIHCERVPGAFEIPFACKQLMDHDFSAVIALGAVVRGETPHFDFVAAECARGVMQLNLEGNIPVIFGVLTTNTLEQARARAVRADKGGAAARAALQMSGALLPPS